MSTLNYRNQIILDEDNYQAWRERTCVILRAEKVLLCVFRDPCRLAGKWTTEEAAAKERRARQILRLLVSARLWAKANRHHQCAYDIWLELERSQARKEAKKLNQQVRKLLLQLRNVQMAPPNVVHASLELVEIFDKLKALGSPLSDEDKIKCIIRALPNHYQEPLSAYLAQQQQQNCNCHRFNLKNLQQLIVMVSQIAQAEAFTTNINSDTSVIQLTSPNSVTDSPSVPSIRDNLGEIDLSVAKEDEPKHTHLDDRYTTNLETIYCETPTDELVQIQQQANYCQDIADPITPPQEHQNQGVIVHAETIQSPDDQSTAWSPTTNTLTWRTSRQDSPPTNSKFPCCKPGKLCDPRLHRIQEKPQFKPQLKKREYKIPHITKPTTPPLTTDRNSEEKKESGEEDENSLGEIKTTADGQKFKRVSFVFSDNHRLNIVNDLSILYKYETINTFTILMRDNTKLQANQKGLVKSDSGSISVFYVPASDNNYLSINAMNSKYCMPKAGDKEYSDTRIRDMVKYNRLKDSNKIILKVYLPSQHHYHHHQSKAPFSLKRHYINHRHNNHHKHHQKRDSQSRSPSRGASASPCSRNLFDFSPRVHNTKSEHNNDSDSKRLKGEENKSNNDNQTTKIEWIIDAEDNNDDDDDEPGLAYDLLASVEQNKLLSPSFK